MSTTSFASTTVSTSNTLFPSSSDDTAASSIYLPLIGKSIHNTVIYKVSLTEKGILFGPVMNGDRRRYIRTRVVIDPETGFNKNIINAVPIRASLRNSLNPLTWWRARNARDLVYAMLHDRKSGLTLPEKPHCCEFLTRGIPKNAIGGEIYAKVVQQGNGKMVFSLHLVFDFGNPVSGNTIELPM
jgi:hypothetical protein